MSCRIPLGSLTVITGVSGSGKSTLAFDTLYAEGQRRYVASLSAYARQFLERLPRPDVDFISNLPPAIAIERRNRVTNARSTVGTRDRDPRSSAPALRARSARPGARTASGRVRAGHGRGRSRTRWCARFAGQRVAIGAPLPRAARARRRPRCASACSREGFTRLLGRGRRGARSSRSCRLASFDAPAQSGWLLIDRLVPRDGRRAGAARRGGRERLRARRRRRCGVVAEAGERARLPRGLRLRRLRARLPAPEPALFSFNSPLGACQSCQGFGRIPELDRERVRAGPGAARSTGGARALRHALGPARPAQAPEGLRAGGGPDRPALRRAVRALTRLGVPRRRRPLARRAGLLRLPRAQALQGAGPRDDRALPALRTCPAAAARACAPRRSACAWTAARSRGLPLDARRAVASGSTALELARGARRARGRLLEDLRARVGTTAAVGLGYVSLDRPMRTLSGGEAQRIQLATALGGVLTASLYVLDEPSIGLHARDVARLLRVLDASATRATPSSWSSTRSR